MRHITYKTYKSAKPRTGREQLVRKTLSLGSRPIACLNWLTLIYEFTEHHNHTKLRYHFKIVKSQLMLPKISCKA